MKEEWLFPNAIVPVDVETTAALVAEIHRLIGVVGGMALAQPEQEPVAWVSEDVCKGQYIDGRPRKIWWECEKGVGTAFYTTPPQRKPLTDKAITKVIDSMPKKMKGFMVDWDWCIYFARAIEAAHGIKENT